MSNINIDQISAFRSELEKSASWASVGRKAWNLFGDPNLMRQTAKSTFGKNIGNARKAVDPILKKQRTLLSNAEGSVSAISSRMSALDKGVSRYSRKNRGILERVSFGRIGKRGRVDKLRQATLERRKSMPDLNKQFHQRRMVSSQYKKKLKGTESVLAKREAEIAASHASEMGGIRAREIGNTIVRTGIVATPTLGLAAAGKSIYDKRSSSPQSGSYSGYQGGSYY